LLQPLREGKAETDDLVARSTVAHITGYYVDVDEMDRHGNVHTLKRWVRATPMLFALTWGGNYATRMSYVLVSCLLL
jgi:hypothetical protein